MHELVPKIARPLEFLLGAVFLLAAVLKIYDPNLFLGQIYGYQVITDPALLGPVAIVAIGLETFLGLAMVLGVRMGGLIHGLTQAMLVFYTVLVAYAWAVHGLTDCGCFGAIKMSPSVTILKNLIMMAVAGIAWYGLRAREQEPRNASSFNKKVAASAILTLAACGYTWSAVYGNGGQDVSITPVAAKEEPAAPETTAESEPSSPAKETAACDPLFAGYTVVDEFGEVYDLSTGSYLVALLSMTCDHCMESVPVLNEYAFDPDLPKLVALCFEPEAGSKDQFTLLTAPQFPMHGIGNNFLEFSKLIGKAPPRLAWVVDGCARQVWDDTAPFRDDLLDFFSQET